MGNALLSSLVCTSQYVVFTLDTNKPNMMIVYCHCLTASGLRVPEKYDSKNSASLIMLLCEKVLNFTTSIFGEEIGNRLDQVCNCVE